jgi:hypothetical protein
MAKLRTDNDLTPDHLRGLLRHFADLRNLVFRRDYRIVPAITRPVP